jgi:hypothetical protein
MATQFAPVELATIKQGDFIIECEEAFRRVNERLIKHVEQFERSAQAVLKMIVSVKYDSEKDAYAIVTDIEEKLPKKPSRVTTAFVSEDPVNGHPCLFAQSAGTHKGDPHQQLLCTEDGKVIDQKTGKAK